MKHNSLEHVLKMFEPKVRENPKVEKKAKPKKRFTMRKPKVKQ